MGQKAIRKTLVGVFLLILVGVGVLLPRFPADTFDTIWLLVGLVSGVYLCIEGAGPRDVRLRFLDWRTGRWGKAVEWGGAVILFALYLWDFGVDLPIILLGAFGLGSVLAWNRYYKNLNDEQDRLQQNENA